MKFPTTLKLLSAGIAAAGLLGAAHAADVKFGFAAPLTGPIPRPCRCSAGPGARRRPLTCVQGRVLSSRQCILKSMMWRIR